MKNNITLLRSVIRNEERKTEDAIYEYTLTVSESKRVSTFRLPLYSIRIKMIKSDGSITEATSGEAFADFGKAVVFFERLVENLATPLNLPYIIEDEVLN